MMMEDRMVRDLPEKSYVSLEDKMLVEDIDGTKLVPVDALKTTIMDKLIFENVEAMKLASINCDSFCMTLGYREAGDGGGAYYKIVYEPTAVDDGGNWLYLYTSDVNRAKFISMDGTVTPEQFGAYGNGRNDDSAIIAKCLKSRYETKFMPGKKYLICSPIEMPSDDNIYIDLNGCILEAGAAVNGILKAPPILSSLKNNRTMVIKNGCIDMTNHGGTPISIDRYIKKLSIENMSILNASGSCLFRGAIKSVIDTCAFCHKSNNSNINHAIDFSCGSSNTPSSQTMDIQNTLFENCSGVGLSDDSSYPHPNTILNIDNCKIIAPESWKSGYQLVKENYTTIRTTNKPYSINISNIDATGIESLVKTQNFFATISIKDVLMNSCINLFNSSNSDAVFTLDGYIRMITDRSTSNIYPFFPKGSGTVHINTTAIILDDNHTEVETTAHDSINTGIAPGGNPLGLQYIGLYGYNYTIFDNTNIETDPLYDGEIVPIKLFRNHTIKLNSNGRVCAISPGNNNQVIGLKCDDDDWCSILDSATVRIKYSRDTTGNILKNEYRISGRRNENGYPNIAYFKYNVSDGLWHQL